MGKGGWYRVELVPISWAWDPRHTQISGRLGSFPLLVIQMELAGPEPACFTSVQEIWALDHSIILSGIMTRSIIHLPVFDNPGLI